jgi:hypothetical protein
LDKNLCYIHNIVHNYTGYYSIFLEPLLLGEGDTISPEELKSRGSSSQDGYDEFQSTNLVIKTVNKNVAILKKRNILAAHGKIWDVPSLHD